MARTNNEMPKQDETIAPTGFAIQEGSGDLEPPLSAEDIAAQVRAEEEVPTKPGIPKGKMPIQAPVIRLAFRTPGELLAWKTGWEGWHLSPAELEDIVEVYTALGLEAPIWLQALIVPVVCYGERFVAYQAVKRSGKIEGKKVVDASGFTPPTSKED